MLASSSFRVLEFKKKHIFTIPSTTFAFLQTMIALFTYLVNSRPTCQYTSNFSVHYHASADIYSFLFLFQTCIVLIIFHFLIIEEYEFQNSPSP